MSWSTIWYLSYFVLWVLVIVQILIVLSLARLVGQLSRRFPPSGAITVDPGPDVGTTLAAALSGTDLYGEPFDFSFPRPRDLFFYYMSPHCTVCNDLLPAARSFFREIAAQADPVIVMVHGSAEVQRAYLQSHGCAKYQAVPEEELPLVWRVAGAPFAVWIGSDGVVKSKGLVDRREHLESLRNAAQSKVPTMASLNAKTDDGFDETGSEHLSEKNATMVR